MNEYLHFISYLKQHSPYFFLVRFWKITVLMLLEGFSVKMKVSSTIFRGKGQNQTEG